MKIVLITFAGLILLPILSYMVVKFGAAGYFRARQREERNAPRSGSDRVAEAQSEQKRNKT